MEILVKEGMCFNCNNNTAVKTSFRDTETGEITNIYFDLCEDCKLIKNCFTCLHSKAWYLRYKGKCDINFELLIYSVWLDEEEYEIEEVKKTFREIVAKYSLESEISPKMSVADFFQLIRKKLQAEMNEKIPDCSMYKMKQLGNTFKDFWNHPPCKRHQRGDATKEEFDEYNCRW